MEHSEFVASVARLHGDALDRGLFFQSCEDERLHGREVQVGGRKLLSFSSCSYLGLEYHPDLIAGAHDALDRYGTQFSSSRGYLSAPLYAALEGTLDQLFDAHTLVTATTTLGHQAFFDAMIDERDAVILDHQVHASVHRAATLARASGAHVELVKHERLEEAVEIVRRLSRTHRRVWFATDGVTSMYGDLAPVALLEYLLEQGPNVCLYVDDAHGMSWAGRHGRGSFLSRMPLGDRTVVATSLNKAFSASGGCLVFPNPEWRERVRQCGGPMVFSGPLQPPMLGAALASAKLHLSEQLAPLQARLAHRVATLTRRLREERLPLLVDNEVPIFFLRTGTPRGAKEIASRLMDDGLYANVSMFPSVPMRRAGIRLALTSVHTMEDIERMVQGLARHVPAVLAEEGLSAEDLDYLFQDTAVGDNVRDWSGLRARALLDAVFGPDSVQSDTTVSMDLEIDPEELRVEVFDSIVQVDREIWDLALGGVGACSWAAMKTAEEAFSGHPLREHNWSFRYVIVRDEVGVPVCVTFFTASLQKDDMLMRHEVSARIEERREEDPYFLTSYAVMMGSGLSEGNHLWLDRDGPWRAALRRALEVGQSLYEGVDADAVMLRDLPASDAELEQFLLEEGYVRVPMFDSWYVSLDFKSDEQLLEKLPTKNRRRFMRKVIQNKPGYSLEILDPGAPPSEDELAHLHRLYRNVSTRKLKLNVFELPKDLILHLLRSQAWEVGVLRLDREHGGPEDGRPVAFYAAHKHDRDYAPLFCGLDYEYVYGRGAYRQLLYHLSFRAVDLGASRLHLGMDAMLEKQRFGAVCHPNSAFVQAREGFNAALMQQVVAELGLASK